MFNHLRAFYHFAETQSFQKAAEHMNCTRPNIIYHVKQLERKTGKLVEKGNLTCLGKSIAARLRSMMWFYEQLEKDLLR